MRTSFVGSMAVSLKVEPTRTFTGPGWEAGGGCDLRCGFKVPASKASTNALRLEAVISPSSLYFTSAAEGLETRRAVGKSSGSTPT